MIGSPWTDRPRHLKVAIANDVAARAGVLEHALLDVGHQCNRFVSGEELLRALQSNDNFDALVIERELPDIGGIELLRAIRGRRQWRMPIIFTSPRDEETDVAYALQLGADGYLTWPIRGAEFVARLEAIVRRGNGREDSQPVAVNGYRLDSDARLLFHHNRPLILTEKELNLAVLLLASPGRLLSRTEIVQCGWRNAASPVRWRTIQTYMCTVRGKLQLTGSNGWRLAAVYRRGYRLEKLDRNTRTLTEGLAA